MDNNPLESPKVGDKNIAPTTTAEQDVVTAGQRRVNLIWETMQALIAGSVVGCTLYVSGRLALISLLPAATERQLAIANTAFMLISNIASLVVGFYFGRTNHQRVGGISPKYDGR
jgi:hypothetical protein